MLYRGVPGNLYRDKQGSDPDAACNELVIRIQPKEAIYLKINNKVRHNARQPAQPQVGRTQCIRTSVCMRAYFTKSVWWHTISVPPEPKQQPSSLTHCSQHQTTTYSSSVTSPLSDMNLETYLFSFTTHTPCHT